MDDARRDADRQAADWFLWLEEEPEDANLRQRFEQWRDADPAHSEAWARISEAGHGLAAAPPGRWEEAAQSKRPHRTASPRRLALAAAIALLLLLPALPMLDLHLRADHITGTGAMETIALKDGSTIRLGPDSAVAIDDGSDTRNVRLLAGRAWFEVTHDPQRPFRVTAGDVTALDLGTGFEVSLLNEGATVAVAHGKVRVEDASSTPGIARDLRPGDWLRISGGHLAGAGRQRAALMGAWRDGNLMVDNRPLGDAIDEIRPWYSGRIVLADSTLAERRVTGIYDLRDPATVLEILVHPAGGKVIHVTPWLMIVTAR